MTTELVLEQETQEVPVKAELLAVWEKYSEIGYEQFGKMQLSQNFAQMMEEALLPCPGGVILDGGCGTGLQFERILRATGAQKIVGVDISKGMLAKATEVGERLSQKNGCRIELKRVDLNQGLPFPDNSFDGQVYHISLMYLPFRSWEYALKEAYRTTKTGGFIVATNAVRGCDLRKAYITETLKEITRKPALIPWLWRMRKVMPRFQKLVDEGIIVYPTEDELSGLLYSLGYIQVETVVRMYNGGAIVSRAIKP